MRAILNPDAEECIPRRVRRGHRHSDRERYGCSLRSGEAGCSVGRHTHAGRSERTVGVGWDGCSQPADSKARIGLGTREPQWSLKKQKRESGGGGAGLTVCG